MNNALHIDTRTHAQEEFFISENYKFQYQSIFEFGTVPDSGIVEPHAIYAGELSVELTQGKKIILVTSRRFATDRFVHYEGQSFPVDFAHWSKMPEGILQKLE